MTDTQEDDVNISKERLGQLFILVGPGGVGKNTLMNEVLLRLDNLKQLPTATTRPIRASEQHGREHLFLTLAEFQDLIDKQALIEYTEVRPGQFYGVPRATVQDAIDQANDLIADVEVLGATILREQYPENTILVFIAPPSMDRLEKQMRERGTDEDTIKDRMKRAIMEMPFAPLCDYLIVNDNLETGADELHAIITHEQHDTDPLMSKHTHEISYSVRVIVFKDGEVLAEPLISPLNQGTPPAQKALDMLTRAFAIHTVADILKQESPDPQVKFNPILIDHSPEAYSIRYTFAYQLTDTSIKVADSFTWTPITGTIDLK